jgi:hypothetical protein
MIIAHNQTESYLLLIICAIVYYNSLRNRSSLLRKAIIPAKWSSWRYLRYNGDDSSFLNLTGMTQPAFNQLVTIVFHNESKHIIGRYPQLDEFDQLGLLIMYLNSPLELKHLSLLFGIVPSSASMIIKKMLRKVFETLKNHPIAKVKFPMSRKTKLRYAKMVERRQPEVRNIIGFVDGLSLPVKCSEDDEEQSAYYNSYHHDTVVNNVFAFSPEGKIIFAAFNFPGSWHDAQVASELIKTAASKLDSFALCVDQGFPRSGKVKDKLVGPLSKKSRAKLHPAIKDFILNLHNIYTSLRQAAEWGMRALQGTFARLKARLTENCEKRYLILACIILLHNYRTELVGLNQIKTVFHPEYEQYVNVNGYDRIRKYFSIDD